VFVIPAKAGIQDCMYLFIKHIWIPAFAGMTMPGFFKELFIRE